ncbi:MAG: carbon-nitrogen hydrolase family protein [Candidatus Aminicenantes bacterium]|nr:carbon-nitrogen hydrolase family protein [Candidatus Aminicenantes bacterium]
MNVALVQQHASPDRENNIRRGVEALREAARAGASLIAFSELSFLRFLPQSPATADTRALAEPIPGPTTDLFSKLAREHGVVTVLNLFERDGDKTYDSSPVIDIDGRILGVARMVQIMEGPGFHERGYYAPGDKDAFVFQTGIGRIGVAICYDRHYPEHMRLLALQGAELVVVPQAGVAGEWTPGLFEAELRVAAFQNGYFAALVNRVGEEEVNHFAGESFVVDPDGRVIGRAPRDEDTILHAECDLDQIPRSYAQRHFLHDRRPGFYRAAGLLD